MQSNSDADQKSEAWLISVEVNSSVVHINGKRTRVFSKSKKQAIAQDILDKDQTHDQTLNLLPAGEMASGSFYQRQKKKPYNHKNLACSFTF